jgi:hypothetical protein
MLGLEYLHIYQNQVVTNCIPNHLGQHVDSKRESLKILIGIVLLNWLDSSLFQFIINAILCTYSKHFVIAINFE